MRIVHVNTTVGGGAARAAQRLCDGLTRAGHESLMYALRRGAPQPMTVHYNPPDSLPAIVGRKLRQKRIARDFAPYATTRPQGYEQFSDDRSEHGRHVLAQMPRTDVIHLHWVPGFIDYGSFLPAATGIAPIVWTAHDMNPFTGGCHYDDGCGRFSQRCGACPQLGSPDPRDLSTDVWFRKQMALDSCDGRLQVVVCSNWMARQARASSLLGKFPIHVIPLGLDTELFSPRDKSAARNILNIPFGARVLMFAADSVTNRRKGFSLLLDALSGLPEADDVIVVAVGGDSPPVVPGVKVIHLGHVGDDRLLAAAYSAADLFVIPSLQEAFGQTALEAMACGTPVVGFNVGGIPDIVRDGQTGVLVPPGDAGALRSAIVRVLQDAPARAAMGRASRERVVQQFTLGAMTNAYVSLYQSLIQK